METLTFILGMVLRIGIPVELRLSWSVLFHCLDARWQNQAEQEGFPQDKTCSNQLLEYTNCSLRAGKLAELLPILMRRAGRCSAGDGILQEKCLKCRVFKEAPVPAAVWPAA
jgi:hypothetical protein